MSEILTENDSVNIVRHKVVFVGDVSVGKTSIINRINGSEFQESYDVQ